MTTNAMRPHKKTADACWALIKSLLDDGHRPSSLDDKEVDSACAALIEVACDSVVRAERTHGAGR